MLPACHSFLPTGNCIFRCRVLLKYFGRAFALLPFLIDDYNNYMRNQGRLCCSFILSELFSFLSIQWQFQIVVLSNRFFIKGIGGKIDKIWNVRDLKNGKMCIFLFN
jgi:hypothetical protein